MSKKVRIKEIKQMIGDNEEGGLNSMFEEMMGIKNVEPEIIIPKFVKVRNTVRHIYKILILFNNILLPDFPEYKSSFDEIKVFADELKENVCVGNTDDTEETYEDVSKDDMNGLYKKLKENTYIKRLIIQCGQMKECSKYFAELDKLELNFPGQIPGLSLQIFEFSTLDLKKLWATNITPKVKEYILNVLHLFYKDLFQIYRVTTSPDVDIDKFTGLLVESISKLKTQPGLSRCNNAFKRIEKSVVLLKDNFDEYYRDSIASSNPNMIIESFIVDVSNQGGSNARLTREFRQIIQYMDKVSKQNGKSNDPRIQEVFKMLRKNFEIMEQKSSKKPEIIPVKTESKDLEDIDFTIPDTFDLDQTMAEIDSIDSTNSKKKNKKKLD